MDAQYDSPIKKHNHPTAQQTQHLAVPPDKWEHVRVVWVRLQCEWEEWLIHLCAKRSFLSLVAKHPGKNLLEAAIPDIGQVLAGKKRPNSKMLKHVAEIALEKRLRKSPSLFSNGAPRRAARTGERPVEGDWAPRGPTGVAQPRSNSVNRKRRNIVRPPLSTPSLSKLSPTIISKENPLREVGRIFCLKLSLFNSKTIEKTTQQALWP